MSIFISVEIIALYPRLDRARVYGGVAKISSQLYSMNLIARDFENLKESTLYYNNLDAFQENLFPIMSKIDQKKFHVWKDRLLIPEEKPIKKKSSTPKGWVPAF
ncbi:hypothetical protein RGL65_002079 [Vibrio parahaemolyticus]|nr:hypothetical protein [Vibrio parahaemolyticus]